jgi:hypothetical protein
MSSKQDSNDPAYSGPGYMSNLMLSSHTEFLCSVEQALQAARINLIDMHVEASQVTKKNPTFWLNNFYNSNLVQRIIIIKGSRGALRIYYFVG